MFKLVRKIFVGASLMMLIAACVSTANLKVSAQSKAEDNSTLAQVSEGWSLTPRADFRPGFKDVPVYLFEVSYDCRNNSGISQVALWNRTDKFVTSVKLGWWLSSEDDKKSTLMEGETSFISFEKRLGGNKVIRIEPNIVSFTELTRTLTSLRVSSAKDYRVEVAVVGATFADGTSWNRTEQQAKFQPIKYTLAQGTDCGTRTCQNQRCKYERLRGQICVDSTCERCAPIDEFRCTLGSCFGPVGP